MGSGGKFIWATPTDGPPSDVLEAAAREFGLVVRYCSHARLLEVVRDEGCEVAGIDLGPRHAEAFAVLRELHARAPRLTIFAAAQDSGFEVLRTALEAGAADFFSLPLGAQEIQKALIKLRRAQTAVASTAGEIITVCGARGGVGVTTVAVNLAARLATVTGAGVAIADLDLQRGDVAAFLNLTPLNSLATVATAAGPVDEIFLASTLTRHGSGLFVLPAPQQIEEADGIGHADAELALRLMRAQFRYTVVDTPRTISGPTLAAFEQADRLLLLTDRSVPGVRSARRLLELWNRMNIPFERISMLFSDLTRGPVSSQDAIRALGKEVLVSIPNDAAAASTAMNAGVPLNGKHSALGVAIGELAAKLTGVAASKARHGRLMGRLFGKEVRK
jgi:pilus assembly protein CpaE